MTIEITVTYAINKVVDVPAELAPDVDGNYPDRKEFEAFVEKHSNAMYGEFVASGLPMSEAWVHTEAFETKHYREVYSKG